MSRCIAYLESEIKNVIALRAFELGEKIVGGKAFPGVFANEWSHRSAARSHVKGLIDKSEENLVLPLDLLVNFIP